MTILEILNFIKNELKKSGIDTYKYESYVILGFVLNCDKTYILINQNKILDEKFINEIKVIIDKRKTNVPLQHILGEQEFMGLTFKVSPDVLIPRPETEILVEEIVKLIKNKFSLKEVSILDIGTGSGCISISLAKNISNCKITSLDISQNALNIANQNSILNNVSDKINFVKSNLFDNLKNEKFDIIVSNPPYIPTSDINELMPEVKFYEPLISLDGGEDGLNFYKKIISNSKVFLKENGYLFFEMGINQDNDIYNIMLENFSDIEIIKDLSGINRVIYGKFKN